MTDPVTVLQLYHGVDRSKLDVLIRALELVEEHEDMHLISCGRGYHAVPATDAHHICDGVSGSHPALGYVQVLWPRYNNPSSIDVFSSIDPEKWNG